MAWKMELKKAAAALKTAWMKERECIDWDKTGIEFISWEDVSKYGKKKTK